MFSHSSSCLDLAHTPCERSICVFLCPLSCFTQKAKASTQLSLALISMQLRSQKVRSQQELVHVFNPSTCEFRAGLGHIVSSRTSRATQRNLILKTNKTTNNHCQQQQKPEPLQGSQNYPVSKQQPPPPNKTKDPESQVPNLNQPKRLRGAL